MDINNNPILLSLVKGSLEGDTDAMVMLAKEIIKGHLPQPELTPFILLEAAARKGNSHAASILCLINDDNEGKSEQSEPSSIQIPVKPVSIEGTNVNPADKEEFPKPKDNLDGEVPNEDNNKPNTLLSASFKYRRWRDSDDDDKDPDDYDSAMQLYEQAVEEFMEGRRDMDDDLLEGIVLLTKHYTYKEINEEIALKYNKIGAENGQPTLAYTWALHLRKNNKIEEAIHYFRIALNGEFSNVSACQSLAMLFLETPGYFNKNKEECLALIKEGIEHMEQGDQYAQKDSVLLYMLHGDFYRKIREYGKAIEIYKVALEKTKHVLPQLAAIAAQNIAELLNERGKGKEALKYSRISKELSSKS